MNCEWHVPQYIIDIDFVLLIVYISPFFAMLKAIQVWSMLILIPCIRSSHDLVLNLHMHAYGDRLNINNKQT